MQKQLCEPSEDSAPQKQLPEPSEDSFPTKQLETIASALQSAKEDVTRVNVKKRLARLFRPRVDGTLLVPPELMEQYKDLEKRESLVDDFIQSGLAKDGVKD